MKKNKKIMLLITLIVVAITIVGVKLPEKVEDIYNTNEYLSTEPQTLAEIEAITGEYSVMPLSTIGVEVSTFSDLKYYLELDDGNEYHIFLKNDITITEKINQAGTKVLKVVGSDNVSANYGTYMRTLTNGINVSTLSDNNTTMIQAWGNLTIQNVKFDGQNKESSTSTNLFVVGTTSVYWCEFINGGEAGIHVTNGANLKFYAGKVHDNDGNTNRTGHGIGSKGTVDVHWGSFYGNRDGIHSAYSTGTVNIVGDGDVYIYGNERGLDIISGSKANIPDRTEIYENTYGAYVTGSGSTLTMTSGLVYDNSVGILAREASSVTFSDGIVQGNVEGLNIGGASTTALISGTASIIGNSNCGVVIYDSASVEMTDNTGIYTNGVDGVVNSSGTFTLTSGNIFDNAASGIDTYANGTTNINGGGVYSNAQYGLKTTGAVNVNSGEIHDNASGLYLLGGTTTIKVGEIYSNEQVGLCSTDSSVCNISGGNFYENPQAVRAETSSKVTISGGNFYNNTQHGLVTYTDSTIEMTDGYVYGNTIMGVVNVSGTFTMSGGEIHTNSSHGIDTYAEAVATNINGGKIYSNTNSGIRVAGALNITDGEIYENLYGVYTYPSGTSSAKISGGDIYDNTEHGVYMTGSANNVEISGGIISNNTNTGIYNEDSATLTITNGSINGNAIGIYNASNTTISGGTFSDNSDYGIYSTGDSANLEMSGGGFYSNLGGEKIAIYHDGATCKVTGGTFESDQRIYLASDDKYVLTDTAYPVFKIEPNSYTRARTLVSTAGNEYATTEIDNVTLVESTDTTMYKRVVDSDIVLWDKTKVVTKYQDAEGNTLADSVTTEDWAEEAYTTEAADIARYRLTATPANATGTYGDTDTEVIYVYEPDTTQVNVNYIDQSTGDVLDTATVTGIVGDAYTTEAKIIDGYELVVTPSNAAGTLTSETITVTYEYRKLSTVTVKHIDVVSNTVITTDTVAVKEGNTYTSTVKTIDGYTNVSKPENETITIARTDVELTYGYRKNTAGVDVKYVDQVTGTEIATSKHLDGLEGIAYSTSAESVTGYELVVTPSNASGTYTVAKITVTYEYRKLSTVTVKHMDVISNTVLSTDTATLKEGETYTASVKTIDGYTNVSTPENETITIGNTDTELTYGYRKNTAGVDVKYVDQVTGAEIATSKHLDGLEGVAYSTSAESVAGYELVVTPSNASGTYTVDKITVTYEYRKLSTVTVEHMDLVSNTVITTDTATLKEGETYTASVKTIDGYTNISKPENETITIGNTDTELTYGYRKNTAGVDVKYIDQVAGTEIATSKHLDGLEGIAYSTSAESVTGYELVVTPSNASGTYTVDKITVTYEYRKLSTVTVKHVDLVSNTVITTDTATLKEGETYTASVKTIDGYTNISKPENETITIGNTDVELTYGYKKTTAGVDVIYIDQSTGEEIADTEHIDGLEGVAYSTTSKDISGYQLVVTPSNASGNLTVEKITVTYEYRKLSTITIKHIDENTGDVLNTETVTLKEGDSYTSSSKAISGYVNTVKPESETVIVARTDIELVYKYKKTTGGVDVRYIDQVTGEDLVDLEHIDGLEGASYTTSAKDISGYQLVTAPSNASGNMTVDTITVIYEYRKLSTVTVKHVDLNTNTVLSTDTATLKEGDTYTTSVKTIDGYTNVSIPDNEEITIGRTDVELTYGYRKNTAGVDVKYVDQVTGAEIATSKHLDGLEGNAYSTSAESVTGYELVLTPDNANGTYTVEKITVTYEYRKLSTVTVKHMDIVSSTVITTDTAILKEGETYTASVKTIDGYTNVSKPENETITIGSTDTELTYGYRKNTAGVDVKYVDQVTGTEIATSKHLDGLEGVAYSTSAESITGYELVVTPSNASGIYTVDKITITYEYRKLSTVTVKHIDLNTNLVITTDTATLKEGDKYTSSVKTIDGYTNVSTPENETITIGNTDVELTYGYKKISAGVDVVYIDQVTGEEIADTVHVDGLENDSYTSSAKDISGYQVVESPDNETVSMTVNKVTLTYEYRKLSTITIKHIDENTDAVLDTVEVTLKEGDSYTSTVKTISGYVNTVKPESETVTVARTDIELVYKYKKTTGGVDVRYIDQVTGEDLVNAEHIDGLEGASYTTSAKDIDGYELVVAPSNVSGTMTVDAITVTYEYRKLSTVTVKHIDANTNEVLMTVEDTLKEGDSYTSTVKTITGYENVSKPENETITVGRTNVELVYGYKKTTAGVDIKYIDQSTNTELVTTEHIDGLEGNSYTTTAKDIEGYELVVTPDNANGTFTVSKITVTYEYRKLSKVTVNHIDANSGSILATEEVTLKEGEKYTSSVKTIDGYTNVSKPDSETITVGRTDIELTYGYKKTTGGVNVKYIDQVNGDVLADAEHIDGLEGASYTTTAKDIEGYELVVTPNNASGNFTVDTITVTYEYRKVSTVTVKYIDENDNSVIQREEHKLKEGDTYTSTVKTIDGYQNTSKPENETITVGRTSLELIYGYRKTTAGVDVRYLDQVTQDALVSTEHLDGLEGIAYTTTAKDIEGYELVSIPSNANGTYTVDKIIVTYEYRKLSTLTIKHVDENTGAVLDTETVTLKEGDTYTANAKTIDGYVNTSTPDSETITMGREDIEITYGYKKTTGGVNIRYIDQVTGTDIVSPEHLDGVEGTAYTSAAKTIDGYELVLTPDNASGNMTVDTTTVTYEYRKLSTLTINHIDANTGTVLDTQEVILKEGDTYTANAKTIDGYVNTSTPDNETITMGREDIEITYGYKKTTGGVNVRYIDQVTGEDIVSPEHIEGVEGTAYNTTSKDIDGYELVVTPTNTNGTMTVDTITVTYEYRKLSKVTVKHVDGNTKEIIESEEKILKEGDSYTSVVKTIDGYENTLKPDIETITVGNTDIELIYEYKKISAGVDIKYIDQETGTELATMEHIDGLEGDSYTTTPKDIEGYDLVVTPDNANGNMTVDKITVTYEYAIVEGTITITKVDKKDHTILLSGSTLKLEKLDDEGNVDETFTSVEETTDDTGKAEFTEVEIGTYEITEIIAPFGYQLASKSIEVEITEENREINVLQESSVKLELPKTGSINYTVGISAIGLLMMVLSKLVKKRKIINR